MPYVPPQFPNGRRVVATTVGREDPAERARRRGEVSEGRASYDSDQTTPENRKHWSRASDVPTPMLNNRRTRQNLRIRSRYETDNNAYCRGMISTIGTDTMGPCGPQLCVLTPDHGFNSYVEEEWKRWAESFEVNLPGKLHLLDECRRVEGEGFLAFFSDDDADANTGHSLNFNVISPRRVINPASNGNTELGTTSGNTYNDDGVIVSLKNGRPVTIQVASEVDDLRNASVGSNVIPIKAKYCMQWFGQSRPDQYRGVSEIQAALPLLAYIRRFELATVSTAEIVAAMTAFMRTSNTPAEGPAKIADFSEREITRGMLMSLPDGWEPMQLDPKHPPASYEMFLNMMLRGIGRVLNLPFGVVAGDHSKYNFASGRLDYRLYDDRLMKDRTQCNIRVINPMHREWLAEFARTDPRVAAVVDSGKYYHTWRYSRRPSISPKEDAETEDLRLKNGTTTYAEIYADRGGDWEESFEQRAKETEKMMSLGLDEVFDLKPAPASGGGNADGGGF